ncbi:MAG: phosphoenolpyruvate--protein phosphotransferase [Verrucomicrobium sp.]|nr:phosphoenolpyruvate--protein phosphotransferase [Verrucomicrobium sp.]
MVGIVLVSHSRALAQATRELVAAMTGPGLPLALAAGTGENRAELGTDATEILEALQTVLKEDGALLLMDMGSALLSAETALGFLEDADRARVRLCAAPFVEGAVAAGVSANLGLSLDEVAREAEKALKQKENQLGVPQAPAPVPAAEAAFANGAEKSVEAVILNPHGLHARPAAKLIQAAGRFKDADITISNATTGRGPVSARSLSSVGGLEILQGHTVRLGAHGPHAGEALEELRQLIAAGLGEEVSPLPAAVPQKKQEKAASTPRGEAVAQPLGGGLALGPAFFADAALPEVAAAPGAGADAEAKRLEAALATARKDLTAEYGKAHASLGAERAAIFEAQLLLLDDPALVETAQSLIKEGQAAPAAWRESAARLVAHYRALEDEYLRQRAADMVDVGRRVLAALGVSVPPVFDLPEPGILVVDDLAPSDAASLSPRRVLGVLCRDGGTTSHSAVLLRGRGIPALVQARGLLEALRAGTTVAFDGTSAEVWIDPDPALRQKLEARRQAEAAARAAEEKAALEPAVTKDGHHVEVLANIGGEKDAASARAKGAEGVGLLRTEFLFLDRPTPPNEEEQVALLEKIFDAAGKMPVVVRTLDAGGDKNLPYLHMAPEANPFLGVRALRLCLREPELFQTQLRALLRAGAGRDIHLLLPMVSDLSELRLARAALETAHAALEKEGRPHLWPAPLGVMIEIPAAALLADSLAREADFFSIGTNDLTQYALAADRGNSALAALQDALHPAVLQLIASVVRAAHAHKKKVAICGEAAGDPAAAQVLVGLGVDELSMSPARIPALKARLRECAYGDLQALAAKALALENAAAVRALFAKK